MKIAVVAFFVTATLWLPAWAQAHEGKAPVRVRKEKAARTRPCWEEAGVSKGAMEQRRALERSSRAEVESVCANRTLDPRQRREQIRAIRERTRQQLDALITPQQREAMKVCQEERGRKEGGGFHAGGGGSKEGPCALSETAPEREP
jgi:hypothetical protein